MGHLKYGFFEKGAEMVATVGMTKNPRCEFQTGSK